MTDEVSRAAHINCDVDTSKFAQHHTLGGNRHQASPGDHTHDGNRSRPLTYVRGPINSVVQTTETLLFEVPIFDSGTYKIKVIGRFIDDVSDGTDTGGSTLDTRYGLVNCSSANPGLEYRTGQGWRYFGSGIAAVATGLKWSGTTGGAIRPMLYGTNQGLTFSYGLGYSYNPAHGATENSEIIDECVVNITSVQPGAKIQYFAIAASDPKTGAFTRSVFGRESSDPSAGTYIEVTRISG